MTSLFSVFIPLYIYPTWYIPDTEWYTLADIMAAHPRVEYLLFVNPDSGPPAIENTDYTAGFGVLEDQGNDSHIKILGYVPTNYGAISIDTVKADIDLYYKFWPTHMDGILIDEMDNVTGHETYYTSLTNHIHTEYGSDQLVIGNPGTATIPSYVNTVDVVQVLEPEDYPTLSTVQSFTLNNTFSRDKFAIGVHSTTVYDAPLIAQFAQHAKYMFVTDDVLANPYDALSSWLTNLSVQAEKIPTNTKSKHAVIGNSNNDVTKISGIDINAF